MRTLAVGWRTGAAPALHGSTALSAGVAKAGVGLGEAASDPQPIRFTLTGLTLTPVSVMASATPAGPAALTGWVAARRVTAVTDLRVTGIQLAR